MNIFIATVTTIILATTGIANDNAKNEVKNEGEKSVVAVSTKKHTAPDKTIKPQVSTPIPSTIVEEKYVAEVVSAQGDTVRYKPYFAPRKIKY